MFMCVYIFCFTFHRSSVINMDVNKLSSTSSKRMCSIHRGCLQLKEQGLRQKLLVIYVPLTQHRAWHVLCHKHWVNEYTDECLNE